MGRREHCALVFATAFATHATALGAGFVWLDHAHIEDGAAIASPSRLLDLFRGGFAGTGYYRPLMAVSESLDAIVGGPRVFHLTSLVWHSLASVMVLVAGAALGRSRRAALFAGLLFAVHPLSSIVADAIAFRSEAIITASLLLLLWAHLRDRPAIAAVALAVGALTKESALVLGPVLVVLVEVGRAPRCARRAVFVAELAAFASALALRLRFAPSWRAVHEPLDAGDAIGTRLAAIAKSAAAVLVPVDRSICDAFTVTHWWQVNALAGALVVGVLLAVAWRRRGITLLVAVTLLPVLQIVPVARWWSPHYLYLPLAFIAMELGVAGDRLVAARPRAALALAGLASVLGVVTLVDGLRFADDAALWTSEVRKTPACREGQLYLGEVERTNGHWAAAGRRYEAALALRPGVLAYVDRSAALQNLGTVRFEEGRLSDARRAYLAALAGTLEPRRRRELIHNLAGAALADGDPAEAARLLESETSRPDALAESLELRAMALRRLGREDEARTLVERLPAKSR